MKGRNRKWFELLYYFALVYQQMSDRQVRPASIVEFRRNLLVNCVWLPRRRGVSGHPCSKIERNLSADQLSHQSTREAQGGGIKSFKQWSFKWKCSKLVRPSLIFPSFAFLPSQIFPIFLKRAWCNLKDKGKSFPPVLIGILFIFFQESVFLNLI